MDKPTVAACYVSWKHAACCSGQETHSAALLSTLRFLIRLHHSSLLLGNNRLCSSHTVSRLSALPAALQNICCRSCRSGCSVQTPAFSLLSTSSGADSLYISVTLKAQHYSKMLRYFWVPGQNDTFSSHMFSNKTQAKQEEATEKISLSVDLIAAESIHASPVGEKLYSHC